MDTSLNPAMKLAKGREMRPNYTRVKSKVQELRKQFGLYEPPVDPVRVAKGLGVAVKFVEFEEASSQVSGFYDPDDHTIYVNKHEYPLRQNFTVAHELAHAILHREWARTN